MEIRELTCISCPIGCLLKVEIEDKEVVKVTGNSCPRGEVYARKECTNPTRIVTTTVKVNNGIINSVSVKTKSDIPKELIFDVMKALKGLSVNAPVKIGDVILENVLGTGVNIVATKDIKSINS